MKNKELIISNNLHIMTKYEMRKNKLIGKRFYNDCLSCDYDILRINSGDSIIPYSQIKNLFSFVVRSKKWAKVYEGYEFVV